MPDNGAQPISRKPDRELAINTKRKGVAAICCAALLLVATPACTTAERVSTSMKVKNAVDKLGERGSVSVTAHFDATPDQIYRYLQQGQGKGKGRKARENARLLADLELAVAIGAGKPLAELTKRDRADSAMAVNFGGQDVFAVKSVDKKLYVRLNLEVLARETNGTGLALRDAQELGRLAGELPASLGAARAALSGKWVRIRPRDLGELTDAMGGEAGKHTEQLAQATAVLHSAALQHQVTSAVTDTLGKHARLRAAGTRQGAERFKLTLPARDAGRALAAALRPVQRQLGDPDLTVLEKAPDNEIEAEVAIRHDTLSTLTVDIGQFDRGRSGKLPLKLDFAAGEVLLVAAPFNARQLSPQDLLAALAHVAMRSPELSSVLPTLSTL